MNSILADVRLSAFLRGYDFTALCWYLFDWEHFFYVVFLHLHSCYWAWDQGFGFFTLFSWHWGYTHVCWPALNSVKVHHWSSKALLYAWVLSQNCVEAMFVLRLSFLWQTPFWSHWVPTAGWFPTILSLHLPRYCICSLSCCQCMVPLAASG